MEGKKLSNLAGDILPDKWQIPSVGTLGTIQNTYTKGCLGITDKKYPYPGSSVVPEVCNSADVGQQWEQYDWKGAECVNSFKLLNPNSGFILTMDAANTLTIGSA